MDFNKYSQKWQQRFQFFEQYGAPYSPEFKQGYKILPFNQKTKINLNFYAFFFGFIYLLILGLWKKALTLVLILLALEIGLSILDVPDGLIRAVGFAYSICCSMIANYAYYLKEAKGQQNWNPFEGLHLL